MIGAIIIDDEKNNVENLKGLLGKYCPSIQVLATANNAAEGANSILHYRPDLIFLDIQMPGKNGFEMLQMLDRRDFEVIFVTAFDQYGIQAVKFSAIDYLLKPVDVEELKTAVEKSSAKIALKDQNSQLENLLMLLQHKERRSEHRLALPIARETRFVNPEHIIRCESFNNYTHFHLEGGEKIVISRPIFEYEEILAAYDFIRCHQSHLVNKSKIRSWARGEGSFLLLSDGSQVPVSRNKKEAVSAALAYPGQ